MKVLRNHQQEKAYDELGLKALKFQNEKEEDKLFHRMGTLPSQHPARKTKVS